MSPCPDCGAPSEGAYCPSCGQRVDVDPRSLAFWLRTFFDETLSLDGRLPRTLKALALKPGFLTGEWLEGKRSRWSQPFRLYLLCSVLFFGVTLLSPPGFAYINIPQELSPADQALTLSLSATERAWIDSQSAAAARAASQILILLVPVLGLLLRLMYPGRRTYVEHLVHALHLQAFLFLALIGYQGIRASGLATGYLFGVVALLFLAWILTYVVISSVGVYGVTPRRGVLGSVGVGGAYVVVLLAGFFTAAGFGAQDPLASVREAEGLYWRVKADAQAGDSMPSPARLTAATVRYERLEAHLHTASVRAHLADLLLLASRHADARRSAEGALVLNPHHLVALSVAARASDRLGDTASAAEYRSRFRESYDDRIGDETFARHRTELAELLAAGGGHPPP